MGGPKKVLSSSLGIRKGVGLQIKAITAQLKGCDQAIHRTTAKTAKSIGSPHHPPVQGQGVDVARPVVAKQDGNIIGVQSKPESHGPL